MRKIQIFALIAVLSAAVSCVYPFDPELGHSDRRLVVEGDILIGSTSTITLSYMAFLDEKNAENVPQSTVEVQSEDGVRYVAKYTSDQKYLVDLTEAPNDVRYRMYVKLNSGAEYVSSWEYPRLPATVDNITFEYDGYNVKFNLSLHSDDGEQYFRWNFDEVWEYESTYTSYCQYIPVSQGGEDPTGSVLQGKQDIGLHYCWRQNTSSALMLTTTRELESNTVTEKNFYTVVGQSERMSILYSMTVNVETLSEDSFNYWQQMSKNSENVGDLFAPIPSEMRGNIRSLSDSTELVLGYINVSAVSTKRIYIDNAVTKFYQKSYFISEEDKAVCPSQDEWPIYYFSKKYLPVYNDPPSAIFWAPARCVDCTLAGGNKNKPADWPNNHY